jgi:hypothetical protein
MIRKIQPSLPEVVVVIMASGRRRKMGHFCGSVWRTRAIESGHEVAVNPRLFDTPEELLGTLLHEAAHALLFEWGMNGGCGPDGFYHREEFRNVCRKLGLQCVFNNKRYGYNATRWPKGRVPAEYRRVLEILRKDLPWGLKKFSDT